MMKYCVAMALCLVSVPALAQHEDHGGGVMSAAQVGTVDFLSVVGNFSTVLNYEIDYYRELANYQSSLARMESMVGVDLTSTGAQPSSQHPAGGE